MKRFLVFVLALHITMTPAAQESEGPAVTVHYSPDKPAAGAVWTLSLLIEHPLPDEVSVSEPPFPGPLLLDRVLKSPGGEENTRMEYRFFLTGTGTVDLDAFTVSTPQGQTLTSPFSVEVLPKPENPGALRRRLSWEGVPPRLKAGAGAACILRMRGWDTSRPFPPYSLFAPPVPPGFVMEALQPSPDEQAAGIVLRLHIIPLGSTPLALQERAVSYQNAVFEIPPLRAAVDPAAGAAESHNGEGAAGSVGADAHAVPAFPDAGAAAAQYPRLLTQFRGAGEYRCETAQNLWERGYRVEALAELRRGERDHPAGKIFAQLRRAAEQSLGLEHTPDEKPRWPLVLAGIITAGLAAAALVLRFLPGPFFRRLKKMSVPAFILLAAAFAFCLHELNAKASRFALARSCVVRRVPEESGGESGVFREGEQVRILRSRVSQPDKTGAFVFAANRDGSVSGWVPENALIFY